MKCLVTAATRHGSTTEIATIIAGILRDNGIDTVVAEPDDVVSLDGFDGVILGSAIYNGRWLEPARRLVARCREDFAGRDVWVFSSGPLGEPAKPDREPIEANAIGVATRALDHRVFPGRLLRSELGFGEKLLVSGARAADGDFRPWDDLVSWAHGIADRLRTRELAATLDLVRSVEV